MFSHLTELLSFDNTAAQQEEQDLNGATYTTSKSSYNSDAYPSDVDKSQSNVYLAPDEPMEEIPFEVTRSHGVIMPPPHGAMPDGQDEDDSSSSNAIVNGESKEKRGFSLWGGGSKSKSGTDDDDSAVAAVPVMTMSKTDENSELSDGEYGKVVGIAPVQEQAPSVTGKYEPESNKKKKWLVFLAILLVIVAVVVPCAIVVPRNNAAQTKTAANTADGQDDTSGGGTEGGGTTFAPTAAPTVANTGLPQECEPVYESLDSCLLLNITSDQADSCIDCVFGFLPDNTGPCDVLVPSVCNVLAQCDCLVCSDALEEYLDCQSECEINCAA